MWFWETSAEHDRFVMNITAFYSEIATDLMVLYQIIIYLKYKGFVLKGKGKNGYIQYFIEKKPITGSPNESVYVYKKGCPVITRSQKQSNVIKGKGEGGEKMKTAPFFAVVTEATNTSTKTPLYNIRYWDLPIYNFEVDKDEFILKRKAHKFVTAKGVRVRYPNADATLGAYRFYNTLEFPLDDVFRYFQKALIFESYDEKVSPTFYYTKE